MTRLVLIRHAHADTGTPPGRLCGSFDVPLSRCGRAQIHALDNRRVRADRPGVMYTSPLTRARKTAWAISGLWQVRPRVHAALTEIHCGHVEGMWIPDVQREYPEVWKRNLEQADDDFAWPGGESYRAFRHRVLGALGDIAARHEGHRIAVVTHAGVVAQVLGTIRGRPAAVWAPDRPAPLTATEVAWANGSPASIVRFNSRDWV
jgi:broad specificity phosphatase PhoE